MTPKEAKALALKHGSIRKAAQTVGMAQSTFRDRLYGRVKVRKPGKVGRPQATVSTGPAKRKSIADFRSAYDKSFIVPKRVKAALAELGAGWEYEVDFAKMAGISLRDLGMFADQFAPHVIQVREGRRIWTGSKKVADQMRQMI